MWFMDDMPMERGRTIVDVLDAVVADLPTEVAILFSGGVDSGLLAAIVRRRSHPRLYTVGVEGAPDLEAAEDAAARLDLPWRPIIVDGDELERHCRALLQMTPPDDPITLSFELPLHIVATASEENVLITGQGADELFAGYHRYLSMTPAELAKALEMDLAKVMENVVPLDRRIAARQGKEVRHPFLDPRTIEMARSIPSGEMIVDRCRKAPLRQAAELLGLGPMATREKKAAQYGSGIMNVLRARARSRSLTLREYLEELSAGQRYPN